MVISKYEIVILLSMFFIVSSICTHLVMKCAELKRKIKFMAENDLKKLVDECTVEKFDMRMGNISIRPGAGMVKLFADSFYSFLCGTENYVESKLTHQQSGESMLVTVRWWPGGLTPGEVADNLKRELAELKAGTVTVVTTSEPEKG